MQLQTNVLNRFVCAAPLNRVNEAYIMRKRLTTLSKLKFPN